MRPILKPGLRRVWRDDTTLQLGLDPRRALVLRGMGPPLAATLDLLDGTRRRDQVLADARELGVDTGAAVALLDLLGGAQAVDDLSGPAHGQRPEERARLAPDLAALSLLHPEPRGGERALDRRAAARVLVVGAGRVGAAAARLLGAAGVGSVDVVDDTPARQGDLAPGGLRPGDLGRPRGEALRQRIPGPANDGQRGPDLVLLTPAGAEQPDGRRWRAARVPHLAAAVRETTAVVGPLVLPGLTCCLGCLDLHRTERDPGWPTVASQLAGPARGTVDPCEVALATFAASLAVLQALAWLDAPPGVPAPPATAGGTLELALPDWRVRRRSWSVHPSCDCVDQT